MNTIDKDDVLLLTFKRKICDHAKEIDPNDELCWESLAIGFFMALGLSFERAYEYSREAGYKYEYWQK